MRKLMPDNSHIYLYVIEDFPLLSMMLLHKYSVYVINAITVVDFDNPNSTGSLESETARFT